MPRFDKYDGVAGGFRGTLAADVAEADWNKVLGVGFNASGLATPKVASQSGFQGVAIIDRTKRRAGDRVDCMTNGEIVLDSDETQLTAGTTYYLDANGALTTAAPAAGVNAIRVGHTIEAWRLVVRFERVQG